MGRCWKRTLKIEPPVRTSRWARRSAAALVALLCVTIGNASTVLPVSAQEAETEVETEGGLEPSSPEGAFAPPAPDVAVESAPPVVPAMETTTEDTRSPITVEADTLEMEEGGRKVRASGDVAVEWNTTKLRAAQLVVDQRERRVEANGDVAYESDELRVHADRAVLDVDDEIGFLDKADMQLQGQTGRFGGSRLEKMQGRRVLLDDGYFTTCETDLGHAPDWELRGKHLDVRFDDYARMKNARLEVRGVPVFYVPYLVFPTKQTRQSGLLPFTLGTSSNRGFMFSLPGYWAIDKHSDVTMTAVIETSARIGVDGLYRYAPSKKRWGELRAGYYNEEVRGVAKPDTPAVGIPNDRGYAEWTHREYGSKWVGYSDIQWVGDERFFREVVDVDGTAPLRAYRRSQRYTSSSVGAFGFSGFTSGGVSSTAYQDLIGEIIDDGDTTTSDPVLRNTLQKPLNGWVRTDGGVGPVAYAFDSSLATFARDKGADGSRLDMASTFDLPVLSSGPVKAVAWARGRGTAYVMTDRDMLDEDEQLVSRVDEFPLRGVFEGGFDARTKFARDYSLTDSPSWSGLYHTLEPFVAMRYANRSSGDEIPLFDRIEGIDGRDVATYGVDSTFLMRRLPGGKSRGSGLFELGRLSVSQSYNLTRKVLDDHFSDIDVAGFIQPMEKLALRTLASYNVGANQIRGANASISWEMGPIGPILRGPRSRVAASYRYVRSDSANTVLQSTEMLARLSFTRNLSLGLKGLYDIIGNTFVERAVGMTFTSSCDCWSVGVGVVQLVNPSVSFGGNERGNPEELQVRLALELFGLGGFGSRVTERSSPALDSVEYEDVGFWRAGW